MLTSPPLYDYVIINTPFIRMTGNSHATGLNQMSASIQVDTGWSKKVNIEVSLNRINCIEACE